MSNMRWLPIAHLNEFAQLMADLKKIAIAVVREMSLTKPSHV